MGHQTAFDVELIDHISSNVAGTEAWRWGIDESVGGAYGSIGGGRSLSLGWNVGFPGVLLVGILHMASAGALVVAIVGRFHHLVLCCPIYSLLLCISSYVILCYTSGCHGCCGRV